VVPDIAQLHRIQSLAQRAGLKLQPRDAAGFASSYQPISYRGLEFPPSFVWLCTLCDPEQLRRIWIEFDLIGNPCALSQMNDSLRCETPTWPAHLVGFGFTGDEVYCFNYNTPLGEPTIAIVDSYANSYDEEGTRMIDSQDWLENFEKWMEIHADWLPKADAHAARHIIEAQNLAAERSKERGI
jgi:hypothetical protein